MIHRPRLLSTWTPALVDTVTAYAPRPNGTLAEDLPAGALLATDRGNVVVADVDVLTDTVQVTTSADPFTGAPPTRLTYPRAARFAPTHTRWPRTLPGRKPS